MVVIDFVESFWILLILIYFLPSGKKTDETSSNQVSCKEIIDPHSSLYRGKIKRWAPHGCGLNPIQILLIYKIKDIDQEGK